MDCKSENIEMLTGNNYVVWSMKMEALLDAKDLFEEVIMKDEPTKKEDQLIWQRKNKMAFGIIVLSLTAEQAIVWRGYKKARDVWNGLKTKFEGAVEDRRTDLSLELARLKKCQEESIEHYLTRAQGLSQQVSQLGKEVTEREIVRYIVEGLPSDYEPIVLALSTNRGISLINLRETLLNFEKRQSEKRTEKYKVYRTLDKPREKLLCFTCGKPGHFQRDCWHRRNQNKNNKFKRENKVENHRQDHRGQRESSFTVREFALKTDHGYREKTSELVESEWHLDSACTSHMTPNEFLMEEVEESKVKADSSEEQPEEKNGEESTEEKVEEEESKHENGVSEKEVEKEEPVKEEKKDHEEEKKKEDGEKSKAGKGVSNEKEVGKKEPVEQERNGHDEAKEKKEIETETADAEDGTDKRKVEEIGGPGNKESPVGKAKDKWCKRGRPLDPELFEDQRITWSPKGSPNVSQKNYVQKVCLLDETCSVPIQLWRAATVLVRLEIPMDMPQYGAACVENIESGKLFLELSDSELEEGLGITNVKFPKKLTLTFDPGLLVLNF